MIDAPVVSIHIPAVLRVFSGGCCEVTASGETVGEVLLALEHTYPALTGRILRSNGQLLPLLDVFLGATSVRQLDGLSTPIGFEETLSIVPESGYDANAASTFDSHAGSHPIREFHGDISVG